MAPRTRGYALLMTLWMTIILAFILYAVLADSMAEVRVASLRKRQAQAEALARAGVARATVDLKNDLIFDNAEEGEAFDANGDVWASPEEGKEEATIKGFPGRFDVRVENLDGLIPINQLGPQALPLLQRIAEDIGYTEEDARAVAAAIIDWMDIDEQPLGDDPFGTEGIYYRRRILQDQGVRVREDDTETMPIPNEAFQSLDELLDVYGVTPELYYGPGSAEAEEARAAMEVDPKRKVGERFVIKNDRRRKGEVGLGLRDYFTLYSSGALNLNTAPEHVLAAYLGVSDGSDGGALAAAVVRKRSGGRRRGADNDSAFKTLEQVNEDAELASALKPAQEVIGYDIRGQVFRITSVGRVGDVQKTIRLIVWRGMLSVTRDESFEATDRARDRGERLAERSERRRDKDNELVYNIPTVRIVEWNE